MTESKEYRTKDGTPIVGVKERVACRASIHGIHDDGTPDYSGDTTVFWDDQVPETEDGKILYLCENGGEWTFDQLVSAEEDDED